jgi:hypothetical protein
MPVRVLRAGPPSESGGFHKQLRLEEHAACSAAFYIGVISLLKEIKRELCGAETYRSHSQLTGNNIQFDHLPTKICLNADGFSLCLNVSSGSSMRSPDA